MTWTQLLAVDIDTERFIAITGITMAFALFVRTRLVTGGTITPAYFLILVLNERYTAVLITVAVAITALVLVRTFLLSRFALSKAWLSGSLIIAGALVNTVVDLFARRYTEPFFGIEQLVLVLGLYVTPGLLAYDWERQGFWKTNGAIGIVMAATLVLTTPVLWGAKQLVPGASAVVIEGTGRIPDDLWWIASLLAIVSTLLLRFGLGWRSAGFIGGLFVFDAFTPITFVLATLFAIGTVVIIRILGDITLLTPRQRFQASLIVGAIAGWFGLYWFTRLGYEPVIVINGYALEPLLLVGLMASDMMRSGSSVPTTILGTATSAAMVGGGILLAQSGPLGTAVAVAIVMASIAVALVIAGRQLKEQSAQAVELGREVRTQYQSVDRVQSSG